MLKLLPLKSNSDYLPSCLEIVTQYCDLLFSEIENPIKSFVDALENQNNKAIAAFKENQLIAFAVLYNFQKISEEKFNCYIYGAAKRKVAKELETTIKFLMADLKKQGCIMLRLETYEYNLAMRHLANRLNFKKVGILECNCLKNGKYINNILYEKKL